MDTAPTYLEELNDVQRDAVMTLDGPVLVVAGPGSGKTRVLTFRIAHLIRSGVAPWEILALTFTNKAAREMKSRIEKVVGNKANYVMAGTFHSIFARILRKEAPKIGYPNDFTIYDTDDAKSLLKEIIKLMNLDNTVYKVGAVLSRISSAKSNLITPKAYAQSEELLQQDRMNKMPYVYQIYAKYVKRCEKAGAMDFDDLLLLFFKLLYKNPDGVRQDYQQKFRYVLVDEFQDTNYLQYAIMKLLVDYHGSPQNICVVGDDAQSIYSFRGATIENILQFERDFPSLKVFKLEQNYRSTRHIVQAANQVITHNKKQIKKKIWTDLIEGEKIRLIKGMTDGEEGRRVADSIVEQKTRYHIKNLEIAILYRTNAQSRVFEEYLRRYNLKYRVFGGLSFYQRKEVKDMIAYMRAATNSKDDEAFKRIINYPKRGIGKATIDKISAMADANDISFWDAMGQITLTKRTNSLLLAFRTMIASFNKKAQSADAYDAAMHIAKASGLYKILKSDPTVEGIGRFENFNSLLDGVKEFIDNDEVQNGVIETDKSLGTYLQNIALLTDLDDEKEEDDYITMMSIHSAKGLEFKSVFVVGLEENLFPSYMSLTMPDQIDEERRLFYVAITRAERFLTLSYANSRYQFGQMRFNDPSRFLEEIPQDSIESFGVTIKKKPDFGTPKIIGNFKKPMQARNMPDKIAASDFHPSPTSDIKEGVTVLHRKFGKGTVEMVDGHQNNLLATINFEGIDTPKRIALKYAKLQVL